MLRFVIAFVFAGSVLVLADSAHAAHPAGTEPYPDGTYLRVTVEPFLADAPWFEVGQDIVVTAHWYLASGCPQGPSGEHWNCQALGPMEVPFPENTTIKWTFDNSTRIISRPAENVIVARAMEVGKGAGSVEVVTPEETKSANFTIGDRALGEFFIRPDRAWREGPDGTLDVAFEFYALVGGNFTGRSAPLPSDMNVTWVLNETTYFVETEPANETRTAWHWIRFTEPGYHKVTAQIHSLNKTREASYTSTYWSVLPNRVRTVEEAPPLEVVEPPLGEDASPPGLDTEPLAGEVASGPRLETADAGLLGALSTAGAMAVLFRRKGS